MRCRAAALPPGVTAAQSKERTHALPQRPRGGKRTMGSNAAIDVAISLILMYLLLSLIVTVLNEVIATAADLRAANLQAALTALIDDPALRKQFYDHGLIAGVNN